MPRDDARAELNALVEQIEQDAFQRGWDAAIKHIMSAAANAPAGAVSPTTSNSVTRGRAGYGTVPALVRELLDESGDRGITPAEVVARGKERGDEIAKSSVRQRLRKMKMAGEARNERGRWFRPPVPHGRAGEEGGDVAASQSDELKLGDGGSHAPA